jgi:hypothetical protein
VREFDAAGGDSGRLAVVLRVTVGRPPLGFVVAFAWDAYDCCFVCLPDIGWLPHWLWCGLLPVGELLGLGMELGLHIWCMVWLYYYALALVFGAGRLWSWQWASRRQLVALLASRAHFDRDFGGFLRGPLLASCHIAISSYPALHFEHGRSFGLILGAPFSVCWYCSGFGAGSLLDSGFSHF